jgi:hypothetical protein
MNSLGRPVGIRIPNDTNSFTGFPGNAVATVVLVVLLAGVIQAQDKEARINIGGRRELFVDSFLIDKLDGARQRLHRPVPHEVAIVFDKPWEGNESIYMTVLTDEKAGKFRMYYRGRQVLYDDKGLHVTHPEVVCYAESPDGINWRRPELNLIQFDGSKKNNILLDGKPGHNFAPFIDGRPGCPPKERFKAVGGNSKGLWAYQSEDGIHWEAIQDKPIITGGAFDSQNLVFWDSVKQVYREYHRDFRDGRDIRTSSTKDFLTWPKSKFLEYKPSRVSQLYTNQVSPYHRAPHIYLGFPTRYIDRGWTESAKRLPNLPWRQLRGKVSVREGTALTEGMFMSSRDGERFHVWPEAFIRPGLRRKDNWFYGDNYQNLGLIETASQFGDGAPELSMFVSESALQGNSTTIRRHTIRLDGFVSVEAPLSGGTLLTKPLVFDGHKLNLNVSTSAAGSIRVAIQTAAGDAIKGFGLDDCDEIYGDFLEREVTWHGKTDVRAVSGKPVRLQFEIKDANLYSFQFVQ